MPRETERESRGRPRERTPKPERKPASKTDEDKLRTQLPPVGSHHQVLEQQLKTPTNSVPAIDAAFESSDGEKRHPGPKKMKIEKLEPDTQADTPMEPINAESANGEIRRTPTFNSHQVFDLTTADDEEEEKDELTKCAEAPQASEQPPTAASGAFPNLTRLGAVEGSMPEWLKGLTESIQGLHVKSDKTHEYCIQLGSSVAQHDTRLSTLEAVARETTEGYEAAVDRIAALEKAVTELDRKVRSSTPPRSPAPETPRGSRFGGNSPRSPRGRNDFGDMPSPIGRERDPHQDLGLVVGGWSDARVAEAELEVKNLFHAASIPEALLSLSGPAGRTNFLRVTLDFQGKIDWNSKRQFQTTVLNKLRALKSTSGIEGQDKCELWVTKDRSVEERVRIRAVVLTKNFYEKLPSLVPGSSKWPAPEIVWRGQVFIGQTRMIKNIEDGHEPTPFDQIIEDARGNHTVWYLDAVAYSKVTGREKESLQQAWLDFGPSASPIGVGAA